MQLRGGVAESQLRRELKARSRTPKAYKIEAKYRFVLTKANKAATLLDVAQITGSIRISCRSKNIHGLSADAGAFTKQAETLRTRARIGVLRNNSKEPGSVHLALGARTNGIRVLLLG